MEMAQCSFLYTFRFIPFEKPLNNQEIFLYAPSFFHEDTLTSYLNKLLITFFWVQSKFWLMKLWMTDIDGALWMFPRMSLTGAHKCHVQKFHIMMFSLSCVLKALSEGWSLCVVGSCSYTIIPSSFGETYERFFFVAFFIPFSQLTVFSACLRTSKTHSQLTLLHPFFCTHF